MGVLEGKTALVTGASQGIGLASAKALAQEGADVVIMGRREETLGKARDELRDQVSGARIEMSVGDATREDDVKAALGAAHGIGIISTFCQQTAIQMTAQPHIGNVS